MEDTTTSTDIMLSSTDVAAAFDSQIMTSEADIMTLDEQIASTLKTLEDLRSNRTKVEGILLYARTMKERVARGEFGRGEKKEDTPSDAAVTPDASQAASTTQESQTDTQTTSEATTNAQ